MLSFTGGLPSLLFGALRLEIQTDDSASKSNHGKKYLARNMTLRRV